MNPENPAGTIASIESTLRSLERRAEEEQREIEQKEKARADYKTQLNRPFEHEARLKELMVKQAQLNASLDLDKSDSQVVAEPNRKKVLPASFVERVREEMGTAMTL